MENKSSEEKRTVVCHEESQSQTSTHEVLKRKKKKTRPYKLANLHNKPVGVNDSEEWCVIHKD
jgi:hypothetical protein